RRASFAQHNLDTKPDRPDEAGNDDGDDGFAGKTLRLFYILAPTPQVLEIGTQLLTIVLLNSKRDQDGCNRFENCGVNIVLMQLLLFGQRLGYSGPDVLTTHFAHRLMIRATFSNP